MICYSKLNIESHPRGEYDVEGVVRRHQGAVVPGELRAAELAQLAGAAIRAVVDLTAMIRFDSSRLNFSTCSTLEAKPGAHCDIYRQPIVAAGGGGLQVELRELECDDLSRLDGDGVDAGHVVVVEGALAVREVDQAGRRVVGASALWG